MRNRLLLASAGCLVATMALAQSPPAQNGPQNLALKSPSENASANPVAGANSFTMSQARSAIEAKGFTKVTGLRKDKQGVWRAKALKDGQSMPVSVDYQGNVN